MSLLSMLIKETQRWNNKCKKQLFVLYKPLTVCVRVLLKNIANRTNII